MDDKYQQDDIKYEFSKIILDDKSIYIGECDKGIAFGKGTRYYPNGQIDKGNFVLNKLEGYGIRLLPNQDKIDGLFEKGRLVKQNNLKLSYLGKIFKKFTSNKK